MSNLVLFLAHVEADGSMGRAALEALTVAADAAARLSAPLALGLFGVSVGEAINRIAACGATRFLAAEGEDFSQARYSTDAAAAEALCKASGATIVIAPATSRLSRVVPGVASRLGGKADTHITQVNTEAGQVSASRWYYRQRMEAVFQRTHRPWLLLVDLGNANAWSGPAGVAVPEQVVVPVSENLRRTTVLGVREPAADAQTIRPEAELLFVAGAGWTKKQADGQAHVKEAETLILGFLKAARASLGSTKSLVDMGGEGEAVLSFLTHLNQVGQTGSTPRHPKGLAACCHGEEPHTVGWRFVNERRAINLDPGCGWARGKADVLYVADAFAVMAKVNALLQ